MASDQVLVNAPQVSSVPLDYQVPGSLELAIQSVTATFDGSGAAASFLPCLQIIGPGGVVAGTYIDQTTPVSAGASAEVTFGPFLRSSSGSGSQIVVTDGVTSVSNVSNLDFTAGATVSAGGAGIADVQVTSSVLSSMALCGGQVNSDGTVHTGNITASLFSNPGVYRVVSASAFDEPWVVVSPINPLGSLPSIVLASSGGFIDNKTVQIIVTNTSGTLVNHAFSVLMSGTISPFNAYTRVVGITGT